MENDSEDVHCCSRFVVLDGNTLRLSLQLEFPTSHFFFRLSHLINGAAHTQRDRRKNIPTYLQSGPAQGFLLFTV